MEQLVRIEGIAAPLMRENIDTDQITPGKELVRCRTEGYAASLFAYWRYVDDRVLNPEFLLNREPWRRAVILLAGRNFGCGSSREAAPKALRAFGLRVVIAPSFGGIFQGNAVRNGLLPVELPQAVVEELARQVESEPAIATIAVDLQDQQVVAPNGAAYRFTVPELYRQMLLQGLDEIALTLQRSEAIERFRDRDRRRRPWAYRVN